MLSHDDLCIGDITYVKSYTLKEYLNLIVKYFLLGRIISHWFYIKSTLFIRYRKNYVIIHYMKILFIGC